MEALTLNLQSKNQILDYLTSNHLVACESGILNEILIAIDQDDRDKLNWLKQFGDSIRVILMNVNAYRKQLEFGFTEISFDQYGWFTRPEFLNKENLVFGNPWHHGEHSAIYLGRGLNNIWTYAVDYSFGTAGGGYHLSVYGKQFNTREAAFACGLNELKDLMNSKLGNTDTSNYKQPIINATLKDILKAESSLFQLSLF
jgi:hypothetical protein